MQRSNCIKNNKWSKVSSTYTAPKFPFSFIFFLSLTLILKLSQLGFKIYALASKIWLVWLAFILLLNSCLKTGFAKPVLTDKHIILATRALKLPSINKGNRKIVDRCKRCSSWWLLSAKEFLLSLRLEQVFGCVVLVLFFFPFWSLLRGSSCLKFQIFQFLCFMLVCVCLCCSFFPLTSTFSFPLANLNLLQLGTAGAKWIPANKIITRAKSVNDPLLFPESFQSH